MCFAFKLLISYYNSKFYLPLNMYKQNMILRGFNGCFCKNKPVENLDYESQILCEAFGMILNIIYLKIHTKTDIELNIKSKQTKIKFIN